MSTDFDAVREQYQVGWPDDDPFQSRLRLLQSLWRERRRYAAGSHNERPLGSRVESPAAQREMWNFLTPAIAERVRQELGSADGKVIATPRIFDNLLSSQPLCFNLFAELDEDRDLATRVFALLWPGHVREVSEIRFEWSPGRDVERYLGNRSAFDVFVECVTPSGDRGFIGIEVKYHENLRGTGSDHKPRYEEVAAASGEFQDPAATELRKNPLQQIWLDHLLTLSMLQADPGDWPGRGRFVFLHPVANRRCANAVADYRVHLKATETFEARTLEEVVAAIRWHCDAPWIREFHERYLDLSQLEELGVPPLR